MTAPKLGTGIYPRDDLYYGAEVQMERIDMRSVKTLAKERVKELLGRYGYEIRYQFPLESFRFDPATMKIIEQSLPFTMTGAERLFAFNY